MRKRTIVLNPEVITIIKYHNPIPGKNGMIFSIDNVVLDLYLSNLGDRDQLMKLLNQLPIQYAVDVQHWTSFRIGTYREQFSIKMPDNTSFWIGAALNLAKTNWGRARIEFNPNKLSDSEVFKMVFAFLVSHTRPMHRIVRRFDLAVDIPIDRMSVFLVKDARAYWERRHGKELTQYLGSRSSHGRVKVYNKTQESRLDYPLTRLELTLDPAVEYEKINFPTVYYLDNMQMQMDELKATDTERFILNAVLQGYGTTNQLGRKTRAKIERLMGWYVGYVKISARDYSKILDELRRYIKEAPEQSAVMEPPKTPPALPASTGFQPIDDTDGTLPFWILFRMK